MVGLEGKCLGNNTLLRRVGGGGMGDVYLAEQAPLGRRVAVKVMRGEGGPIMTDEARERATRQFALEARAIAALDHPHILPVYDYGEQDGWHYLVMPYIEDGSLADCLAPGAPERLPLPLAPDIVVQIVMQAASALQYAHDRGLIHRDIKPHNLLVKRQDGSAPGIAPMHIYLTDFGVARFLNEISTRTGASGTPQYSAPEQFRGAPVPATDQYALACVAYLLLTGRAAFEGAIVELYHQHLSVSPDAPTRHNPHLSRAVDAVLLRALAKEPEQRYASAHEFAAALEAALAPLVAADALWPRPATVPPIDSPDGPTGSAEVTPPLPTAPPPGTIALLTAADPLGVAHTPTPGGATTEPDGSPAFDAGASPHRRGLPARPIADGPAGLLRGQAAARRRSLVVGIAATLLLAIVTGALLAVPGLRAGGTGTSGAGAGSGSGPLIGATDTNTASQVGLGVRATSTTTHSTSGSVTTATASDGTHGPGATATSTSPSVQPPTTTPVNPPSTPVPTLTAVPASTPTPFPTPISGFQRYVSPTSYYGLDYPVGWSEYSHPPASGDYEDVFYTPSSGLPYFQMHYEDNNQFLTTQDVVAYASTFFGFSPISQVGSSSPIIGGVTCSRGDFTWTDEYGVNHYGVVIGCRSVEGRMYALVYDDNNTSWPIDQSNYLAPMLSSIWFM